MKIDWIDSVNWITAPRNVNAEKTDPVQCRYIDSNRLIDPKTRFFPPNFPKFRDSDRGVWHVEEVLCIAWVLPAGAVPGTMVEGKDETGSGARQRERKRRGTPKGAPPCHGSQSRPGSTSGERDFVPLKVNSCYSRRNKRSSGTSTGTGVGNCRLYAV